MQDAAGGQDETVRIVFEGRIAQMLGINAQPVPAEAVEARMLSTKEAAALLGMSESWVREYVRRGRSPRLHGRKMGGALAFFLPDLIDFMHALPRYDGDDEA